MKVPFEVLSYYEESKKEKAKIFFLSEGENSERYFYKRLFENASYGFNKPSGFILKEIRKTELDKGVSDGLALVRKAIEWCDITNNRFDKDIDRILVTFDLDRLSKDDIIELIKIKRPYILYGFSNPKFEIVQLLSLLSDLSVLEKDYYYQGFPNRVLENAFSSLTHVNSKNPKSGEVVASRYKTLMQHRDYDEVDILLAKDKFCTNVLNILEQLEKGTL